MPLIPTLDQIRSFIEEHLRPYVHSILFANATAEGFANDTSDIDVLLITDDRHSENESWHQAIFGDKRIDFHAIRSSFLLTSVRRLMSEPLNSRSIAYLHRIFSALPIEGLAYWTDVIHGLDMDSFQEKVTWFHFNQVHFRIEDLKGNYLEDDVDSAVANASSLLACSLDSFMASFGRTNPRAKWRVKQLRLLGPEHRWILDNYLDLCQGATLLEAQSAPQAYLSRVTQFTHWLQMAVMVQKLVKPRCPGSGPLLPKHEFDGCIPGPDFRAVSYLDQIRGNFALFGMGNPQKFDLVNALACLGAVSGVGRPELEQLVLAAQPPGSAAPCVTGKLLERWLLPPTEN